MIDLDLIVINNRGRRFGIRIVTAGMNYGLDDCLTHDGEPMVEFYDYTYASDDTHNSAFGPRGQFVSRYYASTLNEIPNDRGLDLMGYEPVWKVDANVIEQVHRLINVQIGANA